jgi:hypothetical protein
MRAGRSIEIGRGEGSEGEWDWNQSEDAHPGDGITIMAKEPSQKQIEANRRNALRSTGPSSKAGKERSRRNALKHGMAAEVLVPEEDRARLDAAMARWTREMGPDNVVEEHLVRRAAVASVTLDRMDEAREDARQDTAREAVRLWERKQQAIARRKAQDLEKDPFNTVVDLEGSAFGCDWLIRQWQAIDAPLSIGLAWDQKGVARAQKLLGFPEGVPGPDGDESVRSLWLLAGALAPTRVTTIPRLDDEADFPTDPADARAALRQFIADQVDRLEALRVESWEAVEGPACRSVARQAAAGDTSPGGQLRHRYHRDADRSCQAAIRQFVNLRDRRRRLLLEIAKEARQIDTPRAPVGGGWWREVDSDPAPPGFQRIADFRAVPEGEGSLPDQPRPGPMAEQATGIPTEAGSPRQPETVGQRNEPISSPDSTADPRRNPHLGMDLRNEPSGPPAAPRWRTEPPRSPDRPARSPADRER